eukprot:gene10475-11573_t
MQRLRYYTQPENNTVPAVEHLSTEAASSIGLEITKNVKDAPFLYQIVAMVTESSTYTHPDIILGKVIFLDRELKTATLAHLKNLEKNSFVMTVGEDTWVESWDRLIHPIDIVFNETTQIYGLRTSRRVIHNQAVVNVIFRHLARSICCSFAQNVKDESSTAVQLERNDCITIFQRIKLVTALIITKCTRTKDTVCRKRDIDDTDSQDYMLLATQAYEVTEGAAADDEETDIEEISTSGEVASVGDPLLRLFAVDYDTGTNALMRL